MTCDQKDCQEPSVITWLNIGHYCQEHFNQEYIRRYPEALTENWKVLDERRKIKGLETPKSYKAGR